MIPHNVTRDDVLRALDRIKRNGVPPGRESRDYYVVFGDDFFPPKYVISVANEFANGEELPARKFIATEARTFLKRLGFEITRGKRFTDVVQSEEISTQATISLERDLEEYIVRNLDQIEDGLRLYSRGGITGRQFSTDAGRIDILAVDKDDNLVVIELKAGTAGYSVVGQILGYIGWIRRNIAGGREVRGIVIADNFDKKLKYALSEIPGISLKRYEVRFVFEDVQEELS